MWGSDNVWPHRLVRFEDMKADLPAVVKRVARHLGAGDPARVAEVAARCTFASMSADRGRYEPVSVQWAPGFKFLRAGRTGDHKAELDEAMRARWEADAEEVLGRPTLGRFLVR